MHFRHLWIALDAKILEVQSGRSLSVSVEEWCTSVRGEQLRAALLVCDISLAVGHGEGEVICTIENNKRGLLFLEALA